jgi:hypothetical protein
MRSAIFRLIWQIATVVLAQEEGTCTAGDATCSAPPTDASKPNHHFSASFQNLSPYRADVHFDDGRFGKYIGTMETDGGKVEIDTHPGHRFFITRHGVREGLVDPDTDEQFFFTVGNDHEAKFILPSHAAPSKTKCKDRYPVCAFEADRGECTANPGWMIVNCCASCEAKEGFGHLLDSNVRCTREKLNTTIPAWKEGSLNDLFTSWASDDKYKEYEPKVISSPNKAFDAKYDGPWIMVFDSFLDDYEINALMKGASFGDGFQRSTDQGAIDPATGEKEKIYQIIALVQMLGVRRNAKNWMV